MHNIFVYGTLRCGKINNYLIKDQEYIDVAKTIDKYKLVIKDLPFLYKEPFENIEGDVYVVTDEKLKELDNFEGHPHFYKREKIFVNVNQEVIECWCYFKNNGK